MGEKKNHINTIGKDVRGRAWELYNANWGTFVALAIMMLFCEAIIGLLTVIHPAFGFLTAVLACVYTYCNVLLAVMIHSGKGKVTLTDVFVEFNINEFLSFIFVLFVKLVIVAAVGIASMILYVGYAMFAHFEIINGVLELTETASLGTYITALLAPLATSNIAYGIFLLNIFIAVFLVAAFNYRYALVEYIAADLVGETPSLCLDKSKKLMDGYKIKLYGNDIILTLQYIGMNLFVSILSTIIIGLAIGHQAATLLESIANQPMLIMDGTDILAQFISLLTNPIVIITGVLSGLLGIVITFIHTNLINLTHSEFYFTLQDVEDNVYVPYVPAKKKKNKNIVETQEIQETQEVVEEADRLEDVPTEETVNNTLEQSFDIPDNDMHYDETKQDDLQDEVFEIE